MKKKRIFIAVAVLFVAIVVMVVPVFSSGRTCGSSQKAMEAWLEAFQQQEITFHRTAQNGRAKAILYEREDLGYCVAVFDRQLLGLRWRYEGMNQLTDHGLLASGHWRNRDLLGSKCTLVICGDNRNGDIGSYVMWDAAEVARDNLEADYILDVYVLDGIAALPKGLQQRAPDGKVLG